VPLDREIDSTGPQIDLEALSVRLRGAGFIAADEEAEELLQCAKGDAMLLESLLERRLRGEPLAWIIGFTVFCGLNVRVDHGVYVPRWQSEPLARRAVARLPPRGVAIDLCTGAGAVAMALRAERPHARVVASEVDERAAACAESNGVDVYRGDLFAPLPRDLEGRVDVIVGVAPYVPTATLSLLPRDTFMFETTLAYDGGVDGADVLRRIVTESPRFLRRGGALLLELGGDEADALEGQMTQRGFSGVTTLLDEDGDVRGVEATYEG
jgi:release factor glutamine methyltransferase